MDPFKNILVTIPQISQNMLNYLGSKLIPPFRTLVWFKPQNLWNKYHYNYNLTFILKIGGIMDKFFNHFFSCLWHKYVSKWLLSFTCLPKKMVIGTLGHPDYRMSLDSLDCLPWYKHNIFIFEQLPWIMFLSE